MQLIAKFNYEQSKFNDECPKIEMKSPTMRVRSVYDCGRFLQLYQKQLDIITEILHRNYSVFKLNRLPPYAESGGLIVVFETFHCRGYSLGWAW